jgi:hypothetical protein
VEFRRVVGPQGLHGEHQRQRVLTRNALLVEYAMKSSEFVRGGHRMLLSFKMTAGSTILIRARATSGAGIGSHLPTR